MRAVSADPFQGVQTAATKSSKRSCRCRCCCCCCRVRVDNRWLRRASGGCIRLQFELLMLALLLLRHKS